MRLHADAINDIIFVQLPICNICEQTQIYDVFPASVKIVRSYRSLK